jgi:uncharacterized membrane protein
MRVLPPIRISDIWTRQYRIDWAAVGRFARDRRETVVVGIGLFFRVLVYLLNRTMWLDEMSLAGNLIDRPILDFSEPLTGDQLAPPAFLIVQRAIVAVLGHSNFAMRLVPLVAGICALFLFADLARRILPRRPAFIALALFAFSDDLIYYSSEMKPYAVDLAIGLAVSVMSLRSLGRPPRARAIAALAALAALAPWCSFASAFVIAGCGTTLLLECVFCGRYRDALCYLALGLGWLASFVVSYGVSRALLGPSTTMYIFWNFAFLPNPVRSLADFQKAGSILLEIFINPLNMVFPIWPGLGIVVPLLLLLPGALWLGRRSRTTLLLLVLPIALAVSASVLRRFPLHGRLILELVPAFFVLIAAGSEWLHGRDVSRFKLWYTTILVLLLVYPCLGAFYYSSWPRHREFNRHGDLHRNVFVE